MRKTILLISLMFVLGLPSVFAACNTAECIQSGLWAAYDFNNASGTIVHDVSGNNNYANLIGTKNNWSNAGATTATGTALCQEQDSSNWMRVNHTFVEDADFMMCVLMYTTVNGNTQDFYSKNGNAMIWGDRNSGMGVYVGSWDGDTDNIPFPHGAYELACIVSQGDGGDIMIRNATVSKNDTWTLDSSNVTQCIGGADACHGDFFDGCWDEFYIWDTATNWSEKADYLYNSGDYRAAFSASDSVPPEITFKFPTNNSAFSNYTGWLNFSAFDDDNTVSNCSVNDTDWTVNSAVTTGNTMNFTFFNTNGAFLPATVNSVNITCNDSEDNVASKILFFSVDNTNPTISLGANNFFDSSNISLENQYDNDLFVNISFTDERDLYAYSINITKAGVSYWNTSNTSINVNIANFSRVVNTTGWVEGLYKVELWASDSHTDRHINPYSWNNNETTITFFTDEGNEVIIQSPNALSSYVLPNTDRYGFGFEFNNVPTAKVFHVQSLNKIVYKEDSDYNGHFVILNNKRGNWVDFEVTSSDCVGGSGCDDTTVVNKINDYHYLVIITRMIGNVTFNSIGGLNVISQNYSWYRGNTTDTHNESLVTGELALFSLNVTNSSPYITNVSAKFFYNFTEYNVSAYKASDHFYFAVNFTSLGVTFGEVVFNYTWNVSVTNPSTSYVHQIDRSQNVSAFSFSRCNTNNTIPVINFTLINETTGERINGTIAVTFNDIRLDYITSRTQNYSFSVNNSDYLDICIYKASNSYIGDAFASYSTPAGSPIFSYNLYQTTFNNNTKNATLYISDGTSQVVFKVVDENDDDVPNVIIKIMKYNVATNTYKTVEILKTNGDGEALGQIVLNDEWYRFVLELEGTTLLITDPTRLYLTTKTFRVGVFSDYFDEYTIYNNVISSLTFNNVTKNFAFTYNDPSNSIGGGCLRVEETGFTGNRLINESCSSSTATTILVNIGSDVDNRNYRAVSWVHFDDRIVTGVLNVDFQTLWKSFGLEGLFFGGLLIGGMSLLMLFSPVAAIVIALLSLFMLSLPNVGFIHMGMPYFISLVVLGIVTIWRVNRAK